MMQYAMLSEKADRTENEDFVQGIVLQDGKNACFVLCDGLGGHGRGEVASRTVAKKVTEIFREEYTTPDFLKYAFEQSQSALLRRQEAEHGKSEMKTTAVVLWIAEDRIQWGHIGDSRLYLFQKGKMVLRTKDHSVPQMLASAGEIKEREIRHHPDRNRLLRVMGTEWEAPKYVLADPVSRQAKQAFLLCSDGFWELIEEKKMERCLKKAKSPEDWLAAMQKIILKSGKGSDMDNYSAIAVFVGGGEER